MSPSDTHTQTKNFAAMLNVPRLLTIQEECAHYQGLGLLHESLPTQTFEPKYVPKMVGLAINHGVPLTDRPTKLSVRPRTSQLQSQPRKSQTKPQQIFTPHLKPSLDRKKKINLLTPSLTNSAPSGKPNRQTELASVVVTTTSIPNPPTHQPTSPLFARRPVLIIVALHMSPLLQR